MKRTINKDQVSFRKITYRPIGLIHSPYEQKTGVPIQGSLSENSLGTMEIFPEFADGLKDVEGFSHLVLLYHMHRVERFELLCKPFLQNKEHGIFAVRAPCRPNPIGFSVVRLEKRDGRILHISEVDILNQTPLLDIKPWVSRFDSRQNTRAGWFDKALKRVRTKDADNRFGQ